jgi:nucleoside-diphosphate-sugar epimerase
MSRSSFLSNQPKHKNVIVFGGLGYLGSRLVPQLLQRGHRVHVVDVNVHNRALGDSDLGQVTVANYMDFDPAWLDGTQAVVNLGGVSTDPMAEYSPAHNFEFNATGAALIALFAAQTPSVEVYLLASSASVYGYCSEDVRADALRETDLLSHQYSIGSRVPYGISKIMSEIAVEQIFKATDKHAIAFRMGTLFGLAPKVRMDLVVHGMIASCLFENHITYRRETFRPLLHIQDAVDLYTACIEDPALLPSGSYNVAGYNIPLQALADSISAILGAKPSVSIASPDGRSYRMSSDKLLSTLRLSDHFAFRTVEEGVDEFLPWIHERRKEFPNLETFLSNPRYNNLESWKHWLRLSARPGASRGSINARVAA